MTQEFETFSDRTLRYFGSLYENIRQSKVLVVGAGAVGTEVVKNLAMLGVKAIDIVDFDKVSESNLNRCVFFHPSQSERVYKVTAIKKEVEMKWPHTTIITHKVPIQKAPESVWDTPLVIVAVDNNEARHYINMRILSLEEKPFIINGAMGRTFVEVQILLPGITSCLICSWSESYSKKFYQNIVKQSCDSFFQETIERFPSISILNSIIGGIISSEAIKILVGLKKWKKTSQWEEENIPKLGHIIRYDIRKHDFSVGKIIRNPYCTEIFCRESFTSQKAHQ